MDAPVGVPSSPVSLAFFLSPEATAGDGAEGLPMVQLSNAKVEFFCSCPAPSPKYIHAVTLPLGYFSINLSL